MGYLRPLGSRNRIAESVVSQSQAPSVFESASQVGGIDYHQNYDDNRPRRMPAREEIGIRQRTQSEDVLSDPQSTQRKIIEEESVARMNEVHKLLNFFLKL